MTRTARCVLFGALMGGMLLAGHGRTAAEDWPTWRYDAGRTAASPESLPADLHLQWTRQLPPPKPAWTKYPRLCFDVSYEPVVMGKTMFVPSMVTDSLTALDTVTGKQRWKFYTDGPVRFAPLAFDGKVCFVSDDGHLYCLNADDGRLLWKLRGLPDERQDRKVLGNDRLISLWPARGGPVSDGKHIYFAAGVWPFEGVYVCAVDAATGRLAWRNEECANIELGLTDHSMRQDTGISPQGYLALIGGKLLVPSGRALPGVFDCQTGKLDPYVTGWGGRDNLAKGCWYVAGNEKFSFQSGDVYDSQTRQRIQIDPANAKELGEFRDVVVTDAAAYFSQPINDGRGYRPAGVGYREVAAWDLTKPPKIEQVEDSNGRKWPAAKFQRAWRLSAPWKVHIKAGSRLYGGAEGKLAAMDLGESGDRPKVSWTTEIEGTPNRILAADGKLFVVTKQGSILAFGPKPTDARKHAVATADPPKADKWTRRAGRLIKATGVKQGYCLVLGAGSGRLTEEIARQSQMHVIVIEPDAAKVAKLRQAYDATGLYGSRIAVVPGDPLSDKLPPYLASLVVTEDATVAGMVAGRPFARRVYRLLRPYGGTACLPVPVGPTDRAADTEATDGMKLSRLGGLSVITRVGPPPGAADWTHEDADGGSSLVSADVRVKAPFGVLWFGGDVDMIYPEWDFTHSRGPTPLVAGGRMFVQIFPYLHSVDVYTGRRLWSRALPAVALDSQRRKLSYVAVADAVYVASGNACHRIDPATGETVEQFKCPEGERTWREVRVHGDRLIGSAGNVLVCLDRHSGKTLWQHRADKELVGFAVSGDQVFCADAALPDRTGKVTKAEGTLTALALSDGGRQWQQEMALPGQKRLPLRLAYSPTNDLLVTVYGTLSAYQGKDGETVWTGKLIEGGNEPMLHRDRIISQVGLQFDPLTCDPMPRLWKISKRGCTRIVAAEKLVTIRHGQASYLDFESGQQTFFRGVRAGCTNSLIPAAGLLNAPNFSHGCACNYPVFSSMALVNLDEAGR